MALLDWIRVSCPGIAIHQSLYSPVQRTFYQGNITAPGARDLPPRTLVEVRDAAELAAILRAANEFREPLQVRQGTGQVQLDLAHPFPPGSLVLDLRHLLGIDVHPERGWIEVGAAVTHGATNDALRPLGYGYPHGWEPITWGGLVSINLSGHAIGRVSDKPGDYVLGLEVVLPTGERLVTGTGAIRKPVGPDLSRLFIGGQGLLGVITRLRLRLVPLPASRAWGWARFTSPADLAATARRTWSDRLAPPSLYEMMDRRFVEDTDLADLVPPGDLLLVQADGEDPAHAQRTLRRLLDLAQRCGAVEVHRLADEAAWNALWEIRRKPVNALAARGDYFVAEVLDVPLDRLDEALARLLGFRDEVERRFGGIRGYLWGHIGSATLHPAFLCPPDWAYDRRVQTAQSIREDLLELKLGWGASVGEHGVFPMHATWYERRYGTASMEVQLALKHALDPNGVLNPGRMSPVPA